MRRELLLLREMRDAVVVIVDLVAGRSAAEIETDTLRRSALLWHFTVLGEAASQVPAEVRDGLPMVPWRAATRLRNRIVHGYWSIDVDTLVATAADDLPDMVKHLEDAILLLDRRRDTESPF